MKNEVFITGAGILLALFLFLAKQNVGFAFVCIALIAYSSYNAYHYKGKKSIGYAVLPICVFILFILSSGVDNTISNIMVFVWFGSLIYFAMNTEFLSVEKAVPIQAQSQPTEKKFCPSCGTALELAAVFCSSCGKEQ